MAHCVASSSLCLSIHDVYAIKSRVINRFSSSTISGMAVSFKRGSPLFVERTSQRKNGSKVASLSIRSEQSTDDGGSLNIWLGRLAMVGFASAITVEIVTGRGLLENFGLITPLPTVALAVTSLVGVLTAVFIFQSATKN